MPEEGMKSRPKSLTTHQYDRNFCELLRSKEQKKVIQTMKCEGVNRIQNNYISYYKMISNSMLQMSY